MQRESLSKLVKGFLSRRMFGSITTLTTLTYYVEIHAMALPAKLCDLTSGKFDVNLLGAHLLEGRTEER